MAYCVSAAMDPIYQRRDSLCAREERHGVEGRSGTACSEHKIDVRALRIDIACSRWSEFDPAVVHMARSYGSAARTESSGGDAIYDSNPALLKATVRPSRHSKMFEAPSSIGLTSYCFLPMAAGGRRAPRRTQEA